MLHVLNKSDMRPGWQASAPVSWSGSSARGPSCCAASAQRAGRCRRARRCRRLAGTHLARRRGRAARLAPAQPGSRLAGHAGLPVGSSCQSSSSSARGGTCQAKVGWVWGHHDCMPTRHTACTQAARCRVKLHVRRTCLHTFIHFILFQQNSASRVRQTQPTCGHLFRTTHRLRNTPQEPPWAS